MAKFVRQRHHVAARRGPVQHHVGVDAWHGVGAEGAAALAWAGRSVDPALIEEARREVAKLGREVAVGVKHDLFALIPADRRVVFCDRGGAVVISDPLQPEQLRLQPVPAPWQLVRTFDRFDQRLDRLIAGLVRKVAAREPCWVAAQPVFCRFVLKQRVEEVRACSQPRLQRPRYRGRSVTPDVALRRVEQAQSLVQRHRFVVAGKIDADCARQFAEESRPSVPAGDRFLG